MSFLLAGCFTIATWLGPRLETLAGARAQDTSLLGSVMGDSRRLFANHFFVKSDVYMHSGFYPSFFDQALKENHLAQTAGAQETKHEEREKHASTKHLLMNQLVRQLVHSVAAKKSENLLTMIMISNTETMSASA